MSIETLNGKVMKNGLGDASNWGLTEIRQVTGYSLIPRTLNVELESPHKLRSDFHLPRHRRTDGRAEHLNFERCQLVMKRGTVRALIARTSTNNWGDQVLEIVAEDHLRSRYGLDDNDQISVEIWVGPNAAAESQAQER